MVLLTSTAVSAAISGFIVCAFTFLLFLSGYVLQQRSVRSLQEALRQPPEPRPTPTLPPQFASPSDLPHNDDSKEVEEVIVNLGGQREVVTVIQPEAADEPSTIGLLQTPDPSHGGLSLAPTSSPLETTSPIDSLAYILTLPLPEDLCSAALFARQQRHSSSLIHSPAIIFLYPSTWETSPSPLHIAALTLLRDIQSEYSLTYHPVEISSIWSGFSINSQLLGELQRNRWDFDRILYLKSPGMVMDSSTLDQTLQLSNIRKSWAPVTASAGHDPEMLLWSRTKGLMMPRGDTRKLVVSAVTKHADHHAQEMEVEMRAKSAAYVLFDEEELDHRRNEKEWYGGLFEKFERERSSICKGRGLLPGDQDKVDLRRI